MNNMQELMRVAREVKKTQVMTTPSLYDPRTTTTWTATPNKHGGVELTFVINK